MYVLNICFFVCMFAGLPHQRVLHLLFLLSVLCLCCFFLLLFVVTYVLFICCVSCLFFLFVFICLSFTLHGEALPEGPYSLAFNALSTSVIARAPLPRGRPIFFFPFGALTGNKILACLFLACLLSFLLACFFIT